MSDKIFKAIVIDDEEKRNTTYRDVLGRKFEVTFINDINTITRKQIMKNDLLVIDICLSKNVNTLTAFKIMKDYNLSLPTVVVSGEWVKPNGEPNEFILQVPSFKNIIKVIGWNDFNKESSNEIISEDIFYDFCRYKNMILGSSSDRYTILHISDPQFGGNISGMACNDNKRIAAFLKEKDIEPDLIVITGDIADKGKKEEYKQAELWIEELAKNLWKCSTDMSMEIRNRIIVVPGNHDYDLSINASDIFDFQFKSNEIDSFLKKENVFEYANQKLGFANFIEFALKLTADEQWYHYMEKAIHLNDRFLNWGINFFLFNTVYNITNRSCENRFDQFYCDLSRLCEQEISCGADVKMGLCNILVMHNPPADFRQGTDAGEKSWGVFQTLIEDNKINICLYGHTHDFSSASRLKGNGGVFCKNMICIPAPSVRLAAASRTEDASRGFNIIELYKENGVINKVKPRYFEMKKASIREMEEESEIFNL